MDPSTLVPTPESIPAPSWLFMGLDILTFSIHILFINVVVGGTFLLLYRAFSGKTAATGAGMLDGLASKIPTGFALGINFGVAPLLFLQVIYGHLFYSSSVLMAVFWILIIPLLILGYYGAYIHSRKSSTAPLLAKIALFATGLILLYVSFMFVNNMTLMAQPEKWSSYFQNRGGTILNLNEPTLIPRYAHFLAASVAVAGLFMAMVWGFRERKKTEGAQGKVKKALKIFGIATAVQIIIGFWFLLALPQNFILQFMGQNIFYTVTLFAGLLIAIGALLSAFLGKLLPTLVHLVVLILIMAITRANLRTLYLEDIFSPRSLTVTPQYGVMALFFAIFAIGLVTVGYMLKISFSTERRVQS
jgi:hypothetical protein